MDTLDQLIDRRTPLDANAPCTEALDRFIREPDALALAVVDGAAPIGLLARDSFLARMENPQTAHLAVRQVIDPDPLIADVTTDLEPFLESALAHAPGALLNGFIAVESGRYVGVGTAVSILAARASRAGRGDGAADFLLRLVGEVADPLKDMLASADKLRKLPSAGESTPHLDHIEARGRSTLELLDTAAQLQRTEQGDRDHNPQSRRVQDLMDEVQARWQARADQSHITLLCSYDGDPECLANLDAGWFHQLMDALIAHALTHARSGVVEASLRTRRIDTDIILEGRVRDNASALSPAYLRQMFDPSHAGVERGEMGVALGLALAARRISALGGSILAEPNIGAGASVAFSFAAHDAVEEARPAPAEEGFAHRRAHVLVVDDNATNRMVVEALCEMFDCSTESAVDGLEAVEFAREGRFDVILMDIKMPRMDGVTATREIRAMPGAAGAVPIVALTANADPDEVREYLRAGMHCVVEKPIKPERLLDALNMVMNIEPHEAGAAAAA